MNQNMMKCSRALELISARIDKEVAFEHEALDAHLQSCPSCRHELQGMRRLDELLWRAHLQERQVADDLVDKVRKRLAPLGVTPCNVLLVDDDPDILLTTRSLLARDFNISVARNALEAQALFGQQEFDVVLTDQVMRGMTGVELLEWVLAHHPQTQRLLWTAYGELDQAVGAINRGRVFRYLTKPFAIEDVRSALQDAGRVAQMERDYRRVVRQLTETNVQLEERVRQRTLELEEVNRELEQRIQALEMFAMTDALTGLPNRKALDHFVERELYLCSRHPAPLALAIIDVDFFKEINSRYDHPGGDQVLRGLAACMKKALRKMDMLGRWAGDEFMLIAPQTNRAGALPLAERLRALVQENPLVYQRHQIPVTVTIGLATVEAGRETTYEQVKLAAAAALMRAKRNGRNCVEIEAVGAAPTNADTVAPHGQNRVESA